MEHKRRRFQFGWLNLKARKNGPDVWVLRYREALEDGCTKTRSVSVGTKQQYPSESLARQASMSFMLSMNNEKPPGLPVFFGALMQRYLAEELPERHSTSSTSLLDQKPHRAKVAGFPDRKYQTVTRRRLAEETRSGSEEQGSSQNPYAHFVQRGDALGTSSLST